MFQFSLSHVLHFIVCFCVCVCASVSLHFFCVVMSSSFLFVLLFPFYVFFLFISRVLSPPTSLISSSIQLFLPFSSFFTLVVKRHSTGRGLGKGVRRGVGGGMEGGEGGHCIHSRTNDDPLFMSSLPPPQSPLPTPHLPTHSLTQSVLTPLYTLVPFPCLIPPPPQPPASFPSPFFLISCWSLSFFHCLLPRLLIYTAS